MTRSPSMSVAKAIGMAALLWVAWQLSHVLLMVFGGVILAVALRSAADALTRRVPIRPSFGVPVVVLSVIIVAWILIALGGQHIAAQLAALREQVPQAMHALEGWLAATFPGAFGFWRDLGPDDVPWQRLVTAAYGTVGVVGILVLVVFVGIYLAIDPQRYVRGVLRLVPATRRAQVAQTMTESADAIWRWLVGQSMSMLFVGAATSIGLFALGVPLAFTLGVIAALLTFVPFFGPLAAGALAVVVAFAQGATQGLYVALLALAIQQVEGHVLTPLVQRWTVALPPALAVVGGVAFGTLFGLIGLAVATPLTVVAIVWVRNLYGDPLAVERAE